MRRGLTRRGEGFNLNRASGMPTSDGGREDEKDHFMDVRAFDLFMHFRGDWFYSSACRCRGQRRSSVVAACGVLRNLSSQVLQVVQLRRDSFQVADAVIVAVR